MPATGTAAFDSTIQTTNVWLHDLMERLAWADQERAYHALRAVLHAVRDRLTVDQIAGLAAQLPLLVRGMFYEGWQPAKAPLKIRKKDEFYEHVSRELDSSTLVSIERITDAVLAVLAKHIDHGEVAHIKATLPGPLREMWP